MTYEERLAAIRKAALSWPTTWEARWTILYLLDVQTLSGPSDPKEPGEWR